MNKKYRLLWDDQRYIFFTRGATTKGKNNFTLAQLPFLNKKNNWTLDKGITSKQDAIPVSSGGMPHITQLQCPAGSCVQCPISAAVVVHAGTPAAVRSPGINISVWATLSITKIFADCCTQNKHLCGLPCLE